MDTNTILYIIGALVIGFWGGVWAGGYVGKLVAKVEAWEKKEQASAASDIAHIKAIFTEVKTLMAELDAKAKADVAAVKTAETKAATVVETIEKAL